MTGKSKWLEKLIFFKDFEATHFLLRKMFTGLRVSIYPVTELGYTSII
jgi:hypothetical protein